MKPTLYEDEDMSGLLFGLVWYAIGLVSAVAYYWLYVLARHVFTHGN